MSDVLDEDSAEIAFAALGLKVDGLSVQLARLEKLTRRASVDYAPTLATISADVAKLELATRALYGAPALKMPVEEFERQLASARAGARKDTERALDESRTELHHAARNLQVMLGQARTGEAQNWRLVQVGTACWAAGLVSFIALYAPLAHTLPQAWAIPEKMAVWIVGKDPWAAAERMMASADAARWRELAMGEALLTENGGQFAACQRRAAQLGRSVTCSVRVKVPEQP